MSDFIIKGDSSSQWTMRAPEPTGRAKLGLQKTRWAKKDAMTRRIRKSKSQLRRRRGFQPKLMAALLPFAVPIGIASVLDTSRYANDVITDPKIGRDSSESGIGSAPHHPFTGGSDHTGGGNEVLLPRRESASAVECLNGERSESSDHHVPGFRYVKKPSAAGISEEASRTDTVPASTSRVQDGEGTLSSSSAMARSPPLVTARPPSASASHLPFSPSEQAARSRNVSAVLVVALKDAHLATLLMATLRACGAMDIFQDFFVVVPGEDLDQVEAILGNSSSFDEAPGEESLQRREIVMVDERQLLLAAGVDKMEARWSTYSLQMALKLLASSLMQTPFYLTLDADILCTKNKLSEQDLLPQGKGNFVPEGRTAHPTWWSSSARALRADENPTGVGFGVTPAILSTAGAKLTLSRLREVHGGDGGFLRRVFDLWAEDPYWRWSEYTLYRTALDHFDTFDALHAVGTTKLLGNESVWYSKQFEAWNVTAAFNEDSAAGFVVVQSTARIGVAKILERLEQALKGEGVCTPSGRSECSLLGNIVRYMGGV